MLATAIQEYVRERRLRRRWGIFFKLTLFLFFGGAAIAYFTVDESLVSGEHTALVEIDGIIGPDDLSADQVNQGLLNAFSAASSVGVILKINSPGGTPVQAAQINAEITRLKALYPDKPVYAAVTDVCASGGYYIAVAADEIFAHPSSIVGSIGVLMNGFGFVGAMEKLGVERRLIAAGENKALLDPFSPVILAQKHHAQTIIDEVHQQFIHAVKAGRGDRLSSNDSEIFSGLFWSGKTAMELGLVDRFGDVQLIARELLGAETLVDYSYRPAFVEQFADQVGTTLHSLLFGRSMQLQ
ncbi:MAG: S49 family peptidase [Gammaproteobacteria bacterium]|nr:S49 family peptidase [Gammaproteobacteria bacterium]